MSSIGVFDNLTCPVDLELLTQAVHFHPCCHKVNEESLYELIERMIPSSPNFKCSMCHRKITAYKIKSKEGSPDLVLLRPCMDEIEKVAFYALISKFILNSKKLKCTLCREVVECCYPDEAISKISKAAETDLSSLRTLELLTDSIHLHPCGHKTNESELETLTRESTKTKEKPNCPECKSVVEDHYPDRTILNVKEAVEKAFPPLKEKKSPKVSEDRKLPQKHLPTYFKVEEEEKVTQCFGHISNFLSKISERIQSEPSLDESERSPRLWSIFDFFSKRDADEQFVPYDLLVFT